MSSASTISSKIVATAQVIFSLLLLYGDTEVMMPGDHMPNLKIGESGLDDDRDSHTTTWRRTSIARTARS